MATVPGHQPVRAAQRGYGAQASFQLCEEWFCPQPSQKPLTTLSSQRGHVLVPRASSGSEAANLSRTEVAEDRTAIQNDPEPERPP